MGRPRLSSDDVVMMIGDGKPKLVELNLAARPAAPLIRDWLEALVERFHVHYEAHAAELPRPNPGLVIRV